METIKSFFKPSSVAIVGASASEKKVGYAVLRNIVSSGYKGKIYPVNPKRKEIMGIKTYNRLQDLPETPELAVIIVPPKSCIESIETLGKMGTRACIVISAGFKETGAEGKALEDQLVNTARKYGIRIVGPNCLGIIDTHTPLNATFATLTPPKGNVAVISQSGALLSAFFTWSVDEMVGFSKIISLGNQSDLTEADFLKYLKDDPETKVILIYLEGLLEGTEFMKSLKEASINKPVFILKVGKTKKGARASSSHTGSITGSDDAYNAAFKKAGAIRVENMRDLFIAAKLFSFSSITPVKNVAILTNAGGPGIMATDAIELSSMNLAELTQETQRKLKEVLPPAASVKNPVDVIGDADSRRFKDALDILINADEVDSIMVMLTPQLMTEIKETAQEIVKRKGKKHIVTVFMGHERVREGVEILKAGRIPNYEFPEEATRALDLMNRYLETKHGFDIPEQESFNIDLKNMPDIIDEYLAFELLEKAGITVIEHKLTRNLEEAKEFAEAIGYPVVAKISAEGLLHKSDLDAVRINIKSSEELEKHYNDLISIAKSHKLNLRGINIEKMAPEGVDVILGFIEDPSFGHVLMFGLGGIYVEILKDVSYAIAPVGYEEAMDMIRSIKAYPLLEGYRGRKRKDIESLADTIVKFSQLCTGCPEFSEGEINPLRVTEKGVYALDARFVKKNV